MSNVRIGSFVYAAPSKSKNERDMWWETKNISYFRVHINNGI